MVHLLQKIPRTVWREWQFAFANYLVGSENSYNISSITLSKQLAYPYGRWEMSVE